MKFFRKITEKLVANYGLVIIFILSLIPLTWFGGGLIIGDHLGYLDAAGDIEYLIHAWYSKCNAGSPNVLIQGLFFPALFWALFKALGLSPVDIEKLWAVFLFMLPGLSMYYLIRVLQGEKKGSVSPLVAAALYMFNGFVIIDPLQENFRLVQIALPMMLAFWMKGLKVRRLKYAVLIAVMSLIYAQSNTNPPSIAIIPIVLFAYLLRYIVQHKRDLRYAAEFTSVVIATCLLMNLWWLNLFYFNVLQGEYGISVRKSVGGIFHSGSFFDQLRLLGFWGWRLGARALYFPYAHLFDQPPLLQLSYLIPILAFAAVILRLKDRDVMFFGLLALVGISLASGPTGHLGPLYSWAFQNVPGFWAFREPWTKFAPLTLFSFSVLLGLSTGDVHERMVKWRPKERSVVVSRLFPPSIVIIVLISAFPLITEVQGDVQVPSYWYEIGDWLESRSKDARVFLLPRSAPFFYGVQYEWGLHAADTPAGLLLPNPILRYTPNPSSYPDELVNKIHELVEPDTAHDIAKLIGMLDAEYVLQQNDLDWKFAGTHGPEEMKTILWDQRGLNFVKTFGELDLYELSDDYRLGRIYATNRFAFAHDISAMFSKVEEDSFQLGGEIVFVLDQLERDTVAELERVKSSIPYRPTITFRRVNPSRYEVKVADARQSFFLALSDTYNPQWKAYVDGKEVESKHHFLANGYANAWYIDRTGDLEVTIEFWPQRSLLVSTIISAIAIALSFLYLAKDKVKAFYRTVTKERGR